MYQFKSMLFAGDPLLQKIADDVRTPQGGFTRISTKQNRKDPAVEKVQLALLDWRPDILPEHGADGNFGTESANAVFAFKRDELGVPPAQIVRDVGPLTVQRLDEIRAGVEGSVPVPSPLVDAVAAACTRLTGHGWHGLMAAHGLDILAADLRTELLKPLAVDRTIPGFEDFAGEGMRGIEPGRPDRSLLYHAFASPNVLVDPQGEPLTEFPTIDEIVAVEDLVFGISPPSLPELAARFPGALMAVAVFATEYRPGSESVHRRHAELCFARTGVARVGDVEPLYDGARRGFLPFVEFDDHGFRVLPARYAAYIAVLLKGQPDVFGPMNTRLFAQADGTRDFFVPIHKLFSGSECLRGMELTVDLLATHVNEKLRRVHTELQRRGHTTGRTSPEIDAPPFFFFNGIAEFDPALGPGVLAPVPHPLVEEATSAEGTTLDWIVPAIPGNGFSPSLTIDAVASDPADPDTEYRPAPEYVHVRHVVGPTGREDLNDDPDAVARVLAGGYRAVHYVDYSGDGAIVAACPQLAVLVPRNVPAYSMVTAPDWYPNVDQRELMEWWELRVPTALKDRVWRARPLSLSDERIAPNVEISGIDFRGDDKTVTAIVSMPLDTLPAQQSLNVPETRRHVHLPDAAAGIFAPGWDTSVDFSQGVAHLAAYGLGSPFPEDAKLCAALSAFWPAVAPDSARSFSAPNPPPPGGVLAPYGTVTPLTDEELGIVGALPWDGVPAAKVVAPNRVEYPNFDFVDYVQAALDRRYTLSLTGQVATTEYQERILASVRAHKALGLPKARDESVWRILSFLVPSPGDPEWLAAEVQAGALLPAPAYRMLFGKRSTQAVSSSNHRKVVANLSETAIVLAGAGSDVLVKRGSGAWQRVAT